MADLAEVQVLRDAIERCTRTEEEWEPRLGALMADPERRRRLEDQAAAVAARIKEADKSLGLLGEVIGIKDLIHVSGLPTTGGSLLPPDLLTHEEGTVVTALRKAGALILGKLVTTPFGFFDPAATLNPFVPGHTPGGSSSGCGAAVAAGLCSLAVGTQTYASTSRPAAYCGVVGFKPSQGRVPMDGILLCAESLDQAGFFSRHVAPLHALSEAVCASWRPDIARNPGAGRVRIGVPEGPLLSRCEPEAMAAFRGTLRALEGKGFDVVSVQCPEDFDRIDRLHRQLMAFEYARFHGRWFADHERLYPPGLAEVIVSGRSVAAEDAAAARRSCRGLRERMDAALQRHALDAWISPGATAPPPRGLGSTGDPSMSLPWSHAGVPTVTLPSGYLQGADNVAGDSLRLPLSITLAGRWGGDEDLLSTAARVEQALLVDPIWQIFGSRSKASI